MSRILARFWILFAFCAAFEGVSNASQISASSGQFTLQVVTGGTVWAWGNNGSGQLGDGTFVNHALAQPVTGITSVTAVAAGGSHSLALKSDGTVWAWGSNSNGQLGDGNVNFHATPNQVPGLTGIIAIAAGQNHSLALKSDGTIWAWGSNGNGQVGDGTVGNNRLSPVAVTATGFTNNITAIAAGANHSLAIVTGGGLWAWGQNANGQVGDGTLVQKVVPTAISLTTCAAGAATAIAGGFSHSLAVVSGTVCAWGLNANGQLGDGTTTQRTAPVATSTLSGITAVSAGSNHSLALKSDNTVWAWGANGVGQLGDTTTTSSLTPVQAVGITTGVEIAAGNSYSVARLSSPVDTVMTWGAEGQGELGDGITDLRPVPIQISGFPANVTRAAAGNGHTLALLSTGIVWGLGNNGNGQLGDGSTTRRLAPVAVSGLTNITAIAAGNTHSLARDSSGNVWAWGANGNGQLGNNTTTQGLVPIQVVGVGGSGFLTNIAGISASGTNSHSLAVSTTGVVYAWGLNNNGQLGDGTTTQRTAPVVVSGLSGVFTAVSAGNNHSMALRNDGTVWAWGSNNNGQLGIGTIDFSSHPTPVQVPGLTGVVAIYAGNLSSFVIKGNGSIWAWGSNHADPNAFQQTTPDENADLPGVLSLAAGNGYALFTIQVGSVFVGGWGANNGGQLGNGTFNFGASPIPSLGFAGKTPSSVSANSHSLAVMTDGTLWGWGIDSNGQLGDNPTIFNATPTATVARGVPDLTITKTHMGNFAAGSPGSYTITVTNIGQASMSGPITVVDTLPAGMSFASGTGSGWTCSAVGGGANCTNPGALGAGASSVITLNVNTTALMFPDQFNLATVSNANDLQALNNTSGDETSATTPTAVTLTPAPTPNPSTYGKAVSLTATVTPSAATGVVTFFDGLTFLGTAAVNSGTAHLNTIMIGPGMRQLGAIFAPNPLTPYAYSSTSAPTPQTVNTMPSASLTPFASSPLVLGGSKVGYLVATADFNGDGILDIAAVDGGLHRVTIYLGNGSGGFTPSVGGPFQTGTSPVAILAVDLNGDGKVDLAIANQGVNTLTILLGNGAGGFAVAQGSPFAVGFNPTSLAFADLNNDGTPRVAVAGLASTQLTKLKRDQFGNFFIDTFPLPSGSRSGVAAGDFNGDLNLDLAFSDTAGTVGIYLKDPNGGYNTLVNIPSTLPHPQGILSASLNNDIYPDLVTWDSTGIEVLLGNGSGGFAEGAGSPFVPGTGAITSISSVSVGDFNGDGILDLFVARTPSSTSKGEVVIMLGNGSGGFTQAASGGYASLSSNLQNAVVGEFNGDGRTDVAITDPGNDGIVVLQGVTASPVSATPSAGSGLTQTFTFTFNAPKGWQSISVLDVLINNYLDGIGACYVAFVPTTSAAGFLFLVDDAGDAGGPFSSTTFPSTGTVQNSQCSIAATGSSFVGSGNTLTLTLAVTFKAPFAGNKVFYMAAQDTNSISSGWHALGTWSVPGAAPTGPWVSGITPPRSTAANQTFTVTFTDPNGFADISIVDVLVNNFLDGIGACYIAYVPSINTLILVDDAGDAGGPYAGTLPGSSSISNSQCTIHSAGSSVTGAGNTVTLTLNLTFNQSFAGDRVIYAAAGSNTANSGWLAVGTVSVP